MLVLSRKFSEVVHIGDDIVIKIIHTGRNGVKLGIDAPPHVRVLRGELCPKQTEAPLESFLKPRLASATN